jgi:hypothetical protein
MITSRIIGYNGTPIKVTGEGELKVVIEQHPPVDDEGVLALPFRQFFTDTGLLSGSSEMNIDGSTNPTDFFISASTEYDIYIKAISFEIADAGAVLNEFGNLSPLTNGVEFCWVTTSNGNYIIDEGLQTNWDIVRLCGGNPAFGSGANSFRANNVSGNSEGFIPVFDTQSLFGMPWGLRLKKNTLDKLVFRVRDNISSIDSFNIIAYGTRI